MNILKEKNLIDFRFQNILTIDKKQSPKKIEKFLKSEIKNILENYMDIIDFDIDLEVINNKYFMSIKTISNRIKNINFIP